MVISKAERTFPRPFLCASSLTGCLALESPGLGEGGETAVVGLLGVGREAAAGKLPARQVIAYAVAARALSLAPRIRTSADLQILFFLTFHIRLAPSWKLQF